MNLRKKFITDCIEHYIKNYPEDYKMVIKSVEEKAKVIDDRRFGRLKGDVKKRIGWRIPEKLMNMIQFGLNGQERFLDKKGEDKWFSEKYPQFFIPDYF